MLGIDQVALTFGGLNPARETLVAALEAVCKDPTEAIKVLKLGPKQLFQIECNLGLGSAPTMRALERFSGTLYDAIDAGSLSAQAWSRAKQSLLIQTSLFGLIPSTDLIPNFRFSASTKLPGINLKQLWSAAHEPIFRRLDQGLIVDLRSKGYVELAPIPSDLESVWIEVVQNTDGELRALNHFNKQAKGRLVRAVLEAQKPVDTWKQVQKVAESIGYQLGEPNAEGQAYLVIGMTPSA